MEAVIFFSSTFYSCGQLLDPLMRRYGPSRDYRSSRGEQELWCFLLPLLLDLFQNCNFSTLSFLNFLI